MKYLSVLVAAVLTLSLAGTGTARAATPSPVEKAIENVKDKLDNLVSAKDEKSPDELALRVATLKKVIGFSIAEANDLKVKLLTADVGDEAEPWRDATVEKLNDALAHYADVKGYLEDEEQTIDLAGVRTIAQEFKEWRAAHFLPTAEAVRDFLLITQEGMAIETAQKRAQKIGEDVRKLKNAKYKVANDLTPLLDKANGLVGEGAKLNETARARFWNEFIVPAIPKASSTEPEATSTNPRDEGTTSTSTAPRKEQPGPATSSLPADFSSATTTSNLSTSTAAAAAFPPSIRDLVKASLAKVREAYQVFIEMSALVRKALR